MNKKTRYVFVRHQDYFDMLNRFESPNCVEFNLYETPNAPDPFRNAFFHFDFYNLRCMKNENVYEEYPEGIAPRAFAAHRAFLNGTDDYLVDLLFYPSSTSRYYGAPLPIGKTLMQLTQMDEKPFYVYIYLRECAPLTLDVICQWLERLSNPLFGDKAKYEFERI